MFIGKFSQGMRRRALLWALVAAFGGTMGAAAHAMRDGGEAAEAPLPCSTTAQFVPPSVPWIGNFYYEVSLRYRDGVVEAADVSAARGTDRKSDELISSSLQEFLKRNYTCAAGSGNSKFYIAVKLKHDLKLPDERRAANLEASERARAAAAASAAAAAASGVVNETLVYVNAGMVCTAMGRPSPPRVNAVGILSMSVAAEVIDGKVTKVDAKLRQGSKDPRLNRMFIDAVADTITSTYVCPGNHLFEQEFMFQMN